MPCRNEAGSLGAMRQAGNLWGGGQGQRMRIGIVFLAVALVGAVILVEGGFPVWSRALLFVPLLFAGLGAFSGLYRTCPTIAAHGARYSSETGETPMANPEDIAAARCLASRVKLNAIVAAGLVTGVTFLIP